MVRASVSKKADFTFILVMTTTTHFMSTHSSESVSSKHKFKVDISDPLSFIDSTSVILCYLTVKELLALHCVNESWYQLLTLQNVDNHYSIEYYGECIFNTMIKIDNPLFKQLDFTSDSINFRFPQKCDYMNNDHFYKLHLSNITKTNRNKFMKYTLPLIGKIAHFALITSHKIKDFGHDEDTDSESKHTKNEENTNNTWLNTYNQQELDPALEDNCEVITLNVHSNILKLVQFIDFLTSMEDKLIKWNENNGNCSDRHNSKKNFKLSTNKLTESPIMQWRPRLITTQCRLQRLCYMISRYKTYPSSIESNEGDSPSFNIFTMIDWFISKTFPTVIKYVTKYSTKASLESVASYTQIASQFRRQCQDLVKQWPIYIHNDWTSFFYLNILNSTSIDASKWALNILIDDDKNKNDKTMLQQKILGTNHGAKSWATVTFSMRQCRINEMRYYKNLILISIEILIQNGVKKFENDVLIEKIQNSLNNNETLECNMSIIKEFDSLVMKIIEMMVNFIDIVDEYYILFEHFFGFFVDLIEMPRRWREHNYSCINDSNINYSDYMKQIERGKGTQFVKVFDQENGEYGKWCIGQIISLSYNKDKNCKQFKVCIGLFKFILACAVHTGIYLAACHT